MAQGNVMIRPRHLSRVTAVFVAVAKIPQDLFYIELRFKGRIRSCWNSWADHKIFKKNVKWCQLWSETHLFAITRTFRYIRPLYFGEHAKFVTEVCDFLKIFSAWKPSCRCIQITWYLSSLTLHTAVVSTIQPLLGPRRNGQTTLYLFQKYLLWEHE